MDATILPPPAAGYPGTGYARYVAGVLMLANLCCYITRFALFVLVQPISHDLRLSDTQISLLQGAAFSIFFVLAGLPVGWLTDRMRRRDILIAAVLIWSVMSMACGFASSYTELFLGRVGVGIGEAALTPAAFSLMADYYPQHRRGRAMAFYYVGTPVGSGLATLGGGLLLHWLGTVTMPSPLNGFAPWQAVFVLAGLPGVLVALLLLSVREPARHDITIKVQKMHHDRDRFGVLSFIAKRWRAYLPITVSIALVQLCAYAVGAWMIPLLVRRDHLSTPEAGAAYGISVMVTGLLAAYYGGRLGDRLLARNRPGGRFRVILYAYLIFIPGIVLLTLASNAVMATAGLTIQFFGVCATASVMYPVLQDITPNQYRGQAIAILSFIVTLGSATIGPTAVASITDHLFHDPAMVGYSILLVTLPCAVAGLAATVLGMRHYSAAQAELRTDVQQGANRKKPPEDIGKVGLQGAIAEMS